MDPCRLYSDRFARVRWQFSSIDGRGHAASVRLRSSFTSWTPLLSSSIYELERLAQVPNKFQFPLFETFHWYAAKAFYEELRGTVGVNAPSLLFHRCLAGNESNSASLNPITQHACESMLHYMSKWLSMDKRVRNEP
jgi:hypothetical protein